jgi:hypothetical protein
VASKAKVITMWHGKKYFRGTKENLFDIFKLNMTTMAKIIKLRKHPTNGKYILEEKKFLSNFFLMIKKLGQTGNSVFMDIYLSLDSLT